MKRVLLIGSLLVSLPACALPAEREPLALLPEGGAPQPYNDLSTRARLQADIAVKAYYIDKWSDVEEAARGLEQTARLMPKATDVPAKQKDTLAKLSDDLAKEAVLLRDAAKDKDSKKVQAPLARVSSLVRELNATPEK